MLNKFLDPPLRAAVSVMHRVCMHAIEAIQNLARDNIVTILRLSMLYFASISLKKLKTL